MARTTAQETRYNVGLLSLGKFINRRCFTRAIYPVYVLFVFAVVMYTYRYIYYDCCGVFLVFCLWCLCISFQIVLVVMFVIVKLSRCLLHSQRRERKSSIWTLGPGWLLLLLLLVIFSCTPPPWHDFSPGHTRSKCLGRSIGSSV